jgi:hypothetical protein
MVTRGGEWDMAHNQGSIGSTRSQADFLGTLALALIAVAVLFPLVILVAAVT